MHLRSPPSSIPICRSITGDGVRQSLRDRRAPYSRSRCTRCRPARRSSTGPSRANGTSRTPTSRTPHGERVVDFAVSNLHVMSYSIPVRACCRSRSSRRTSTRSPISPTSIPYRTSYYAEHWGFCMASMPLDAAGRQATTRSSSIRRSRDGSLTYGEYVYRARPTTRCCFRPTSATPRWPTTICSGVALLTALAQALRPTPHQYTLPLPVRARHDRRDHWLARNEDARRSASSTGSSSPASATAAAPTYKKSRRGNALIDRAMSHVMQHAHPSATSSNSVPMATTSASTARPASTCRSGCSSAASTASSPSITRRRQSWASSSPSTWRVLRSRFCAAIDIIENDRVLLNTQPKCEPRSAGAGSTAPSAATNRCRAEHGDAVGSQPGDGSNSLLDIAERSGLTFAVINAAAGASNRRGSLATPGSAS